MILKEEFVISVVEVKRESDKIVGIEGALFSPHRLEVS